MSTAAEAVTTAAEWAARKRQEALRDATSFLVKGTLLSDAAQRNIAEELVAPDAERLELERLRLLRAVLLKLADRNTEVSHLEWVELVRLARESRE